MRQLARQESAVRVPSAAMLRWRDGGHVALLVMDEPDSSLCLLWGKGNWLKDPPKGWKIRRDRDTATGSGAYHYHCKSNDNGEYVVTATGTGSHDTTKGTELPRKLGDFLAEELNIPLKKDNGKWVVSLLPFVPPGADAPAFLTAALNFEVVED